MNKQQQAIGTCRVCGLEIPGLNHAGQPSREGLDYKAVMGGHEMWHYGDPRYVNCYEKDKKDPSSPWYDDPWNYVDREDLEPPRYNNTFEEYE